ncbi:SusC/RagA family TonB-linked outer membrane protein [Cellulophaga omnivescoria]|uniref:SusC/RagA family TonB-linked outer membrane protein n=1 Tax=Cellulophaga omnivescoria TaxID=1888890 RepID=UPI0009845FED|nr:TonB-dependent receptor [Cellulophaga omnivescoria]
MKKKLTNTLFLHRRKILTLIMKTFIFLFCTTLFSFTSKIGFSQNVRIKIPTDQVVSVNEVFKIIKNQTNYTFIYRSDLFDNYPKIKLNKGTIRANKLLEKTLANGNFICDFSSGKIIAIKKKIKRTDYQKDISTQSQEFVTGTVVDEKNIPIPGVNIIVKGTTKGTMSDFDGNYKIRLPSSKTNPILLFSFMGYKSLEVQVKERSNINVALEPSPAALDEVVVIGYGTSTVKDVTGSVSRISEKEIGYAPMGASVQSILQGKSSGVNVNIQSASPTSPISVVIRGASSLSGNNQPLWVIDGVPQYSASTSGDIANTLYNLNLNDVQSIDILKDASATAVYGSRAANGVVIVTTKKGGTLMDPTIEISNRVGLQKQNFNDFKYMETPDYVRFSDASARESAMTKGGFDYFVRSYLDRQAFYDLNTSEFDKSDFKILEGAYFPGNTNWQDEMTTNPLTLQQDLSVRGGSEATTYFVSFNHKKNEGIIKGGKSILYGGRLNLDTRVSNKLRFGVNLNASTRKTDNKDGMLGVLNKIRPDIPPFNEDGTIFTQDPYTENPYTTLRNTNKGEGLTLSATGFFELDLTNKLQLKSSFTNNYSNSESLEYKRRGSVFNYNGQRTFNDAKSSINVWENTLTYANLFRKKHDLRVLAGYSMENSISESYYISATNFPDDEILNNFGSAANRPYISDSKSENSLISQFARLHYKFDDRYIISGTVRRDGSSRFGADQRWGFFPSGAIAWLITGENFMKKEKIEHIFSYLKLRFSTGLTGSQNLGNYDWITSVGSKQYNELPAIVPNSIGNPNLQWEQTKMTDIGLDFGLFNDRIRGTFGVYKKNSSELIYDSPLPPSSAFNDISSNVASVENRGVEFDIKYDILKKEDSRLTFDFNIASNKNKITEINGTAEELNFPSNWNIYMKVKPGDITGEWYGFKTAGRLLVTAEESIALQSVDNEGNKVYYTDSEETLGDMYYIDQNKDGVIDEEDRVNLGSSTPTAFGGFGLTYQYKGFMINTTFNYAFGHKRLWNLPKSDIRGTGRYNQNNLVADQSAILNSPYDAKFPRIGHYGLAKNSDFSDLYLYDASYLRLSTLNVAYRLPQKYLNGTLLKGVDLTFQATNLLTITKYPGFDPQGNWSSSSIGAGMGVDYGTYPSAQIFNFGVKLTIK